MNAVEAERRVSLRNALIAFSIVVLISIASVAITGFSFGVNNNVFHVPYVLRLNSAPEFLQNQFYLSLRKFTSAVWPLMRLFAAEENVRSMFLAAHVLSRLLTFAALFWFFGCHGLKSIASVAMALLVAGTTPLLVGESPVGGHGLLIHYFTHSELTWGPAITSLVLLQGRRFVLSAVLAGVVFSINAFVGCWLAVALIVQIALNRDLLPNRKTLALSSLGFTVTSAPVAIWVAWALEPQGANADFSWIDYIRSYYSAHFLIEAAEPVALLRLSLVAYTGLIAAGMLQRSRFWLLVISTCGMIFALGAVLPYLVNSRFVFNLHLLRSDGLIWFVCVILAVATSTRLLFAAEPAELRALGFVSLLGLLAPEQAGLFVCATALTLAAWRSRASIEPAAVGDSSGPDRCVAVLVSLALLADFCWEWFFGPFGLLALVRLGLTGLCVLLLIGRAGSGRIRTACIVALVAFSGMVGVASYRWSGTAKATSAADRVPFDELVDRVRGSEWQGDFLVPLRGSFEAFQLRARRPVWVDWKQGAAVMWDPAFHERWISRCQAVGQLDAAESWIAYARSNGIVNVVLDGMDCPAGSSEAYANRRYRLCRLDK